MFTEEKEKCSFHDVKITLVNIQHGIFVESVKSYVDLCNLNLQFYLFLIIFMEKHFDRDILTPKFPLI